ncbi:pyridoxal 5'-phosphate synthase glutaminase subunit PdxT [Microaerobacter geothermalis]|uniref:pyridoxal 5'-phosphate synthase glutaminase subunit PdxT n=1 Tax=Microaerobacter geothermalis TaxID=674972 RepID=UPI001F44CB38|nr:pyridoxal 5'-phosphate synthase glutaminase subunit PdxT [Microaerobacter geothermalis]MCF6095252.1 pyridoxal 5'-phosphate synthase glutaminase subunit PdxT [Microaerobacter geothermalis]
MKIGVLALQGAVAEHLNMIAQLGAESYAIKRPERLQEMDGLIIPGGESTTIGKLIHQYDFYEPLQQFHREEKPIFGTCAGLIIIAKKIAGQDWNHLGLMDITVERNAFGRQRESFEVNLPMPGVANDFRAVFIRAPLIKEVGTNVKILAKHKGEIVAVQEGHLLGASFHPELTEDRRMHEYFLHMVESYKKILNNQ